MRTFWRCCRVGLGMPRGRSTVLYLSYEPYLVGDRADDVARGRAVIAADLNPVAFELGFVRARRTRFAVVLDRVPKAPRMLRWRRLVRWRLQGPLALQQERQRGRCVLGRAGVFGSEVANQLPEKLQLLIAAQDILHLLLEGLDAALGELFPAGHVEPCDRRPGGPLDCPQQPVLTRGDECNGRAVAPGAPGPPDAMDVGLGVAGDVEVDDVADARHVDTSGRDVGCDQNVETAGSEAADGSLASQLVHVAVECVAGVPARFDAFGQFDGRGLGPHEDQHAVEVRRLEQPRQGVELGVTVDQASMLLGVLDGCRLGLDPDSARAFKVGLGNFPDRCRHGCREQRGLMLVRGVPQDPLHVVEEAHSQHLVGLVEHQGL